MTGLDKQLSEVELEIHDHLYSNTDVAEKVDHIIE